MKPVLIQTMIKRNRKDKPTPALDEKLYIDSATPLTKFIFWGLAAIVILSVAIA